MNGVQASQQRSRSHRGSHVEQCGVDIDLVQARKLAPGPGDGWRAARLDGANDLDPRQGARHPLVRSMSTQVPAEGLGLSFLLHELHDGGGIEIYLQRSSCRIAASDTEASIP